MYKYKKRTIYIITTIYILITIIEFIKYLKSNSTLFGLLYFIFTAINIFLLVPCAYNYKKYFSKARISKFIIIIVLGVFSSYILGPITVKTMSYMDSSVQFMKSIMIYKSIFKGIIYFLLILFTAFEFNLDELLKSIRNKSVD